MAYLSGTGNDFERAIDRTWHVRSRELEDAVSAIQAYVRQPSKEHIRSAWKAVAHWKEQHPNEYAKRGAPIEHDLKQELKMACWVWRVPWHPMALGQPVAANVSPRQFVAAVRASLNELGNFACADVFYGSTYDKTTHTHDFNAGFARCASRDPRKQALIEQRYREMKQRGAGGSDPAIAIFHQDRSWHARNYESAHRTVTRQKAGVCASFAKAAAHILTFNRPTGPRVEIVSYPNHVYVLVGRQGGYLANYQIDPNWTAEHGLVIVDAWAGSLGYSTIYEDYGSYSLQAMANPITLVAERPAS